VATEDEREHADRGAGFNAALDGFAAGELPGDRGPAVCERALQVRVKRTGRVGAKQQPDPRVLVVKFTDDLWQPVCAQHPRSADDHWSCRLARSTNHGRGPVGQLQILSAWPSSWLPARVRTMRRPSRSNSRTPSSSSSALMWLVTADCT
jgi:hypothetical protein